MSVISEVDVLASRYAAGMPAAAQAALLVEIEGAARALEALRTRVIGDFDAAGGASLDGSPSTAAWLRHHCGFDPRDAEQRVQTARVRRELPLTAAALVLILAGGWISAFYTNDPAVAALAILLMRYAAVFQFPDGIQVLSSGALRGLKDTRVPMLITVFAYWGVGLPLGAWFGLHLRGGAPGLWIGLILGLAVAALLLALRLWRQIAGPALKLPVT